MHLDPKICNYFKESISVHQLFCTCLLFCVQGVEDVSLWLTDHICSLLVQNERMLFSFRSENEALDWIMMPFLICLFPLQDITPPPLLSVIQKLDRRRFCWISSQWWLCDSLWHSNLSLYCQSFDADMGIKLWVTETPLFSGPIKRSHSSPCVL